MIENFREISCSDYEELSEFFLENNVEIITNLFTAFELSKKNAYWIACVPKKDHFYIGIHNEKIIGFTMLRGWDEGFIIPSFGIFIDHRYHGLGFGNELLEKTIDKATFLECESVRLSVYSNNKAGIRIYEKIGFLETDRIEVVQNGIALEKIIMSLRLK